MTKTTNFPTLDEALYLHSRLLEEFGGTNGVRDLGLLESALTRPRSGYYATVYEQAAALMHSLILNHAFVDGNKRIGFALTAVFLLVNGFHLKVSAKEGEKFIVKNILRDHAGVPAIAKWLQKHSKRK